MADPYAQFLRPLLFSTAGRDPEWLHQQALRTLAWLSRPWVQTTPIPRQLQRQFVVSDGRLQQQLWGTTFANPLGLAAGFDKDGTGAAAWPLLGFGFCELGTVTCHGQPGNPQPRLFRLPQDQAVLNRMGFNNRGSAALAQHLEQLWGSQRSPIPVGINLGKSKVTPLAAAAADYLTSFQRLYPWGDYFVVNVSSPNTPGLRSLQAADQLTPILAALQEANPEAKPILVKIAPDLEWSDIAAVLQLAADYSLGGIIATNTTISRQALRTQTLATGAAVATEAGGISGAPLRARSTEVIRFIYRETQGQLPIVGVGGIFTAADAWEKLTAGASLLQVYTGWIYGGPWMVPQLLRGLLERLEHHGLGSIAAAVGLDHR